MTEQTHDPEAILARYAEGPVRLEAAIAGLSPADLDIALEEDSWTIRQIVHHVVDGDDLWKTCIKAALGRSPGAFTLQWYWDLPQDTWAESWQYARRGIALSLARFRANRRHIVELVQGSPDAWGQGIRVPWPNGQEERVTVQDIVEMQANHVVGHIEDIRRIRRAHNLGDAVV